MMPIDRTRPTLQPSTGLAVALFLLLAACGGGDASTAPGGSEPEDASEPAVASEPGGGTTQVDVEGFAFSPTELTVAAGTTVTFTNSDSVPHTVTHGTDGTAEDGAAFDEQLPVGGEVTITFDEPGTYPITCTIHPAMNMTVVVEG